MSCKCKPIIINCCNCGESDDAGIGIGSTGWSPVLAVVEDGERRVLQIADWTGGEGEKPAVGQYIGSDGFVEDIADAVDIRGSEGEQGVQGSKGDQGIQGVKGEQGIQGPKGEKGDQGPAGSSGVVDTNGQLAAMVQWASAKLDTEYWTGKYHVDGKKIYGKKKKIVPLPNNGSVSSLHNISNLDVVTSITGTIIEIGASIPFVPASSSASSHLHMKISDNKSDISLWTGMNLSAHSAIVILEYTCTDR